MALRPPGLAALLAGSVAALGACSDENIAAVTAAIRVDPTEIELGATPIGTIGRHTVTIASAGSAPLEVRAIVLTAPDAATELSTDLALSQGDALPKSIGPSQTMQFEVQHVPRDARLDQGKVLIVSSDPEQPTLEIPIRQTPVGAPKVAAVPDAEAAEAEAGTTSGVQVLIVSLPFGQVSVGLRKTATLYVVNIGGGNLPLVVSRAAIVEPNRTDLSVAVDPTTLPLSLAPLATNPRPTGPRALKVDVSWSPTVQGSSVAATLRIESNDPTVPLLDIPLSGSTDRVDPAIMRLVPPNGLSIGPVRVGSTGMASLTIHNDGGSALVLDPPALTLNPAGVFALVQAPAALSIGPGLSRTLDVSYTPAAAQMDSGTLHLTPQNPGISAVDVPLNGQGTVVVACTPTAPDPGEPGNQACATAIHRGQIDLGVSFTERRSWNEAMLEPAQDEDWSRFDLAVTSGCDFVGYDVSAGVTLPSGEQAEVCIRVGDCAAPDQSDCAPAGSQARIFLFPGDDVCNAHNNLVPVFVQVRHTGGDPKCQPYTVNFSAR